MKKERCSILHRILYSLCKFKELTYYIYIYKSIHIQKYICIHTYMHKHTQICSGYYICFQGRKINKKVAPLALLLMSSYILLDMSRSHGHSYLEKSQQNQLSSKEAEDYCHWLELIMMHLCTKHNEHSV
uniref:Uncharacterized protein n=1 Tax=Rousettus aegyptiacus TaxID=9407 RepID=A0A7J8HS81_ROUAE|nr:hypothetical protein HJG63_010984 [Rousettus aegyptiacus]